MEAWQEMGCKGRWEPALGVGASTPRFWEPVEGRDSCFLHTEAASWRPRGRWVGVARPTPGNPLVKGSGCPPQAAPTVVSACRHSPCPHVGPGQRAPCAWQKAVGRKLLCVHSFGVCSPCARAGVVSRHPLPLWSLHPSPVAFGRAPHEN